MRIESFDQSDPQRPAVDVTLDDGARGDYIRANLWWGADSQITQWLAHAPPRDEVNFRFPVLPDAIAAWTIQPGEYMDRASIEHFEADVIQSMFDATKNFAWNKEDWRETTASSD